MNVSIRDATPADSDVVADFNSRLSAETEGEALDEATIRAGVAAVLADESKGRYWIAEADDRVVGQIMITFEWSDWRNGMLWWIQSVYVQPDHRRRGVFSALFGHVEHRAEADPAVIGIRLYVDKGNARARATYEHHGLRKTGYEVMQRLFGRP